MTDFPSEWKDLRVVLCHDWLTGMRGGERVLELLAHAFPKAPIFTLFHNRKAVSDSINAHPIWTSWLQGIPGICRHYRWFLPLFPSAIELMDAPPADLLISTSHCVAKGLKPRGRTRHLCYCFTPMRYAWLFYDEYFGSRPARRIAARLLLPLLRKWDIASNASVHRFVAISNHVRDRIRTFYGRDADVVYPFVNLDRWTPDASEQRAGTFDLVVSALVPYKKMDIAVAAYSRSGMPLKIVGAGSEYRRLRAMAGSNIEFLGWRNDSDLLRLYRSCRFLIFPGEEDFGIVPLEAQACGKPVIAFGRGGALETVADRLTGLFFEEQTPEALQAAVARASEIKWDPCAIRANAERFSPAAFVAGLARSIQSTLSS